MFNRALKEVTSVEAVQELNCARIAILRMVEIIKDLDMLDAVISKVVVSGFEHSKLEENGKLLNTQSGHKYIYRQGRLWLVSISLNGETFSLGSFKDIETAVKFRDLFFMKNAVNARNKYLKNCNVKIYLEKNHL